MPLSRDFKGVWIPKEIWFSDDLSLAEKILFTEISYLDNERGCYASNQYFAEFLNVSPRQVTTHIGELKKKGYISVEIKDKTQRTIRVKGKYAGAQATEVQKKLEAMRTELEERMILSRQKGRRG